MFYKISFLLALFVLASCATNNEDEFTDIYVRILTCDCHTISKDGEKITYKTEILLIKPDNTGYQFFDARLPLDVNAMVSEKIKLLETDKLSEYEGQIKKIEKIPVDNQNFMVRVIGSIAGNLLYKAHFDTTSNNLKIKQYVIEGSDTLNIVEPNTDESGIYYFRKVNLEDKTISEQSAGKDITLNNPTGKILSYKDEIIKQITFKNIHISNINEIKTAFSNDEFVINYTIIGQDMRGGDLTKSIILFDDSIKFVFQTTGNKKINFKTYRKIKPQELNQLKKIVSDCKIFQIHGDSIPRASGSLLAQSIFLSIKDKSSWTIGGMLSPLTIKGELTNEKNTEKVMQDCRSHTSSVNGNYEFLFIELDKRFIELDSLAKALQF